MTEKKKSKDELYEEAQALDIEGRSKMDKEELAEAVEVNRHNLVWMEHPALGPERRQQVPRKQFDSAWVNSGWVLAEAPDS